MTLEQKALELLQSWWKDTDGRPYYYDDSNGGMPCFFCDEDETKPHHEDCIYPLIKQIIEASGMTVERVDLVKARHSMNEMPRRENGYSSETVNVFHDEEYLCRGYVMEGLSWIFIEAPEGNFIPTHWEYDENPSS